MLDARLVASLQERLGARGFLDAADAGPRHASDVSALNPLPPLAVLRPASTDDVSFILRLCHDAGQPVVVQGGMTGLCGGGTPQAGEIALSLERMSGIEEIDAESMTMTVLAGTPLQTVQEAAESAGFLFPLDLGARGSCTIGGNIATNAGGNEVIRYGMARALVMGLEAVLADGTVVSSMNRMLKNNAGFDLKHLFIGTEGTLGVITRAVLRLYPAPLSRSTAFCVAPDPARVIQLLHHLQARLGNRLSAFEVMWPDYIAFVTHRVSSLRIPFKPGAGLVVLVECEGGEPESDAETFEAAVGEALENEIISDAVIAQSQRETDDFWRVRDAIGEVTRELVHGTHFDISVPISRMGRLVEVVHGDLDAAFGKLDRLTFGHFGDGNLHVVVAARNPEDQQRVFDIVYARVGELGGSISAEHGIGIAKRKYLHYSRTENEIRLMRILKESLDPKGILNPGRVIP